MHGRTATRYVGMAAVIATMGMISLAGSSTARAEPDQQALEAPPGETEMEATEDIAEDLDAEPGQAGTELAPGRYYIVAKHSDLCLDVQGASLIGGVDILQWDCHGGNNQQFRVRRVHDNYYQIRAVHSGQCLDVEGASQRQGAPVIQWGCHGGDNQQFRLRRRQDGYYEIRPRHSGQCLDVEGGSYGDGASLIQWPCHGGDNQRFYFERADDL